MIRASTTSLQSSLARRLESAAEGLQRALQRRLELGHTAMRGSLLRARLDLELAPALH